MIQPSTSPLLGGLREAGYWVLSDALASQGRFRLVLFSLRFPCAGWAVEKRIYQDSGTNLFLKISNRKAKN